MKLMTNRIEVSIKFIIACWVCIAISLSFMIKIFYHTDFANNFKPVESNEVTNVVITELAYKVESNNEGLTDVSNSDQTEKTIEFKRSKEVVFEDTGYTYGKRIKPAVNINISDESNMRNFTGTVDTEEYRYLGLYNITGYTPKCNHCCGNENGITASGVEAIAGYTVAAPKNIPFGTTLYIEGYGYYVVEDRGNFPNTVIDIAAPDHDACYALTGNNIAVYTVHSNNSTTNEIN